MLFDTTRTFEQAFEYCSSSHERHGLESAAHWHEQRTKLNGTWENASLPPSVVLVVSSGFPRVTCEQAVDCVRMK